MAFTGVLGNLDSNLGSFALGRVSVATLPMSDVGAGSMLALAQNVAREITYNRTVNQGLPIVQAATRTISLVKSVTSTLTLGSNVIGLSSRLATNTLLLTQNAVAEYSRGGKNTIILTQSVNRAMDYARSLHSNLIPFQTLGLNATFRRGVTSTLALTQSAVGRSANAVSQMLSLTQQATCNISKPAASMLLFLHDANVAMTYNKAIPSALFLYQNIQVKKSKSATAFNAFGMSQFARGTLVHTAVASNALVLTHNVVQQRYLKTVGQTLTLAQTATVRKIVNASATSTLMLTGIPALSKTIVRIVQQVLVFKASFEKPTGIASHPTVTVPSVQVIVRRGVTVPSGAYPTLPKCITILQSAEQVIVLPCPEFNDRESGTSKLNIKRAMDGTRRVYRRESVTNKLVYDFIMDRKKAIELRTFLMANNSNPVYLTNFKGELWYVLITNSPFTFTETAYRDSSWGNKSTITLEFEGARLT